MPRHATCTTTTSVRVKRARVRRVVGALLQARLRRTERHVDRVLAASSLLTSAALVITTLTLVPTRNAATSVLSVSLLLATFTLWTIVTSAAKVLLAAAYRA